MHGGVYICTKCGATAAKKPIKLAKTCVQPTSHGKYNKEAYLDGKAPAGFPGWPYKMIHLRENGVVNNVQYQVDQLHRQKLRQIYGPPQQQDADGMDEDGDDQMDQPCHTVEPYEGSSSSDSD